MITILSLFLIQLWTQPSVRILGFGRHFEGFISDPITDLMLNPASFKEFGTGYEDTFNSLQIYAIMQKIDDIDSTVYLDDRKDIFLRRAEPLSLYVLYPTTGFGVRTGAFMRYDRRNYLNAEQCLYGQGGCFGALKIGKFIKIGGEFNWSWNNLPSNFVVVVWDSLNEEYDATVYHGEASREFGAGIVVSDNKIWQLTISTKQNHEKNTFIGERFLWPDGWQSEWHERRKDLRFFTKFEINIHLFKVVFKYDYCEAMMVCRRYYEPEDSSIFKFSCYQPGIAVLYLPYDNITVSGGFIHDYHKYELYYVSSLIILAGFEKRLNAQLKFRFGTTCMYVHKDTYPWIAVFPSIEESYLKNEVNFGLDFYPYDKMGLFLATQDPFNYRKWLFGLSFSL